uniref:Angiopoietin-1 receptor n=1 Tax=Cacopsylla melanoneura TaxID=428564 RepID=A0A8D8QKX5_9HEMI
MYRFLLVYFFFVLGIKHIQGGNEITTVYKFRTIKYDSADVKYLNSCRVSVHVEDNPLHLPLFNINGDSSLPETTIPHMYTDQGTSTWQQVTKNGTTRALPAIRLNKTDFSQIFDVDLHSNAQRTNLYETDIVGKKSVAHDGDVFLNLNKNDNIKTILEVSFQERKYFRVRIYWGCSYSGHTGIQMVLNGNRDFVINYIDSSEFIYAPQNYATDEYGRGHIAIDLSNNITIIDKVSLVTSKAPVLAIQGCNKRYSISHEYDYHLESGNEVLYQLKQKSQITLVSPWVDIKQNQTLFILHSRQTGSNLSVFVEDKNRAGNPIQLPSEDITQVNKTVDKAVVLTKVIVTFPQNWDGQKRIKLTGDGGAIFVRNVWAGRPLDLYRVQQPQPCMKSNIRDIYNTPPLSTRSQSDRMSDCLNGGRLENNFTCICPPGFIGNACEIPCDRNLFGAHCMKQCSTSPNECEGVVLCTPKYGCSCAPGYQGDYCTEKCQINGAFIIVSNKWYTYPTYLENLSLHLDPVYST